MKSVLLVANAAWNILNFRSGMITAFQKNGFRVAVLAPFDGKELALKERGCLCKNIFLNRKGTNPVSDFIYFTRLLIAVKNRKPAAVLGFTIKPNLYGGLACRLLRIPFIPNITGLGTLFIHQSLLTRLVSLVLRFAYGSAAGVFFQNDADRKHFTENRIVKRAKSHLIPGSGIDLTRFHPRPDGKKNGCSFLFMGRFLYDKGIRELLNAAKIAKARDAGVRVQLLGASDDGNAHSVPRAILANKEREGLVEIIERVDDVRPSLAACDCVVLPSYREGLSRTLLEAAAMGKPIIASDVPGCREVVEDGKSGFLCRPRDASDLAEKMIFMARLSHEARTALGKRGREKVEKEFDERIVIQSYLKALAEIRKEP